MDETAAARGQDYVSIFADMTRGKVLYAAEGTRGFATLFRAVCDRPIRRVGRCRRGTVSSPVHPALVDAT